MAKTVVNRQPNWFIIGIITITTALIFFLPFLGVIAMAGVLSYIFAPVYRFLAKRMPRRLAATLTMFSTFAVIVIPLTIIFFNALTQGVAFAGTVTKASAQQGSALHVTAQSIADTVNKTLAPLNNGNPVLTPSDVQEFAQHAIPAVFNSLIDFLGSLATSLPALMTSIIIYGFLFNTFLLYSSSVEKTIRALSPFENETSDLYIERAGSVVVASLRVQVSIAFITAVLSALLLIPLGFGPYFLFFVIGFTLLGMVPLGSGIVMIPICIICMLTGPFWPAFWVLLIYLGVVCNIDSFLRVKLMPKKAKLLPAITTLATFSGIAYFGVLGVIYGPLIAILLLTTLETFIMYREQQIATQGKKLATTTLAP